jgi:GntR family transcriptional regulator / MocR family aminotransferase
MHDSMRMWSTWNMNSHATSTGGQSERALGLDLHLDLQSDGSGIRARLIEALREAMRTGRLRPGFRLPSSRSLAADLGLARNTVVNAYAELVTEGWLTARPGSGTRVAHTSPPRTPTRSTSIRPQTTGPMYDLRPGRPDVSAFPRVEWLRAVRRAVTSAPDEAFGFGDPRGRIELRTELAGYLARTRGASVNPDTVVICSGAAHGLILLGEVLRARGTRSIAVESYGLHVHRNLLANTGLQTPAIALDERGARTELLGDELDVGAVLLTPAHQFPTGVALHPERRTTVIDWARSSGGLVLEDDYDGEFRFDRPPVGALQALDPERVVYLGTTSKALTPALRLGWMVLPEYLVEDVEHAKGHTDYWCGVIDQLTLAEFLSSGAYDRHVRAMRLVYRRRRDQLADILATSSPTAHVSGLAGGLHAVVELPADTEQLVLRAAAGHHLAIDGMSRYRHPASAPRSDALVVGYATPSSSAWAATLESLAAVLNRGLTVPDATPVDQSRRAMRDLHSGPT